MLRKLSIFFVLILGFAVAVPEVPVFSTFLGIKDAQAQETKRRRKTLFDILFKRRNNSAKPRANRGSVNRRNLSDLPGVSAPRNSGNAKRKRSASNSNAAARKPQVLAVKKEDAAKILVVGDFMGGGVAGGLERLYSDNPNIIVVNTSRANSGIVRDDVVDWARRVPELLEEHKPIALVSLVGMNDRQQMRLSTGRVEKLSEAWLAEYNRRVEAIASAGIQRNVPTVWVGLPPVRSGRMNSDYLVLNELVRTKSESVGAVFVDVWDGFTNEAGKFVSAGPDINGQIVRLRGSKGINMTRAGREKLAFFADRALKKLGVVTPGAGPQFASLGLTNSGATQPQIPQYDPVGTGKTIVIPLGSPMSDGGIELEGESDFLKPEAREASVAYDLVEKGIGYVPRDGRVDSGWGLPAVQKEEPADEKKTVEGEATPEAKASGNQLPKVTNIQPAN